MNSFIKKNFNITVLFYILASTFFFERIPSFETALGPIRLYNIVNLILIIVFIRYILQHSPTLNLYKVPPIIYILIAFLGVGAFSIFNVVNPNRFFAAYIGLIFCCFTTFFLSIAKFDYDKLLKMFSWLFVFQVVFSLYQFVGDKYLNLPPSLTGIKDLFRSNVFGIPRIHNTYNEPSYYANALFLGIFLFLFMAFSKFQLFKSIYIKYFYCLITIALFTIFWLTLAKSAWLILPIPLVLVFIILFTNVQTVKLKSLFISVIIVVLIGFSYLILNNPKVSENIYNQFIETVDGTSATSVERKAHFDAAVSLVPTYGLTGIGPGQFGTYARDAIINNLFPYDGNINNPYYELKPDINYRNSINTEKNIVFNVFLEVLVEYGIVGFLLYIVFILLIIFQAIKRMLISNAKFDSKYILNISLLLYVLCSLAQFYFISPVYINPFFVALGLLINIDNSCRTSKI